MLETSLFLLVLVIVGALIFDFINGINDSANAIATCISTKALSIRTAVLMAAACNLLGAIVSTKVAVTIGKDIVDLQAINQLVIVSGLAGAIVWSLITWYSGIPSSSTHALVGGIIGASVAHAGFGALNTTGIKLILVALLASPIVGLLLGFALELIVVYLTKNGNLHKLNYVFRKLQVLTAGFVAFSHGTADAQKSMGIITMALFSYGALSEFKVPYTVIAACALTISAGTAIGGWRIIKTLGTNFVKLQPLDGFCVQSAASLVVLSTSALGFPSSTTHVITSAIIGTALTKRLSAVNWRVAGNIVRAWLFTIPASAVVGFLIHAIIHEIWRLNVGI